MTDPRERIETENVEANVLFLDSQTVDKTAYWWIGMRNDYGAVTWPEVVELAQKILAADREWKRTPPPGCTCDLPAIRSGHGYSTPPPCHHFEEPDEPGFRCPHCAHLKRCHAKLEELSDGK